MGASVEAKRAVATMVEVSFRALVSVQSRWHSRAQATVYSIFNSNKRDVPARSALEENAIKGGVRVAGDLRGPTTLVTDGRLEIDCNPI